MEEGLVAAESRIRGLEFYSLLDELKLSEHYKDLLEEQGFDEWISLQELDDRVLLEIGVSDGMHRKQILACLQAVQNLQISKQTLEMAYSESGKESRNDLPPVTHAESDFQEEQQDREQDVHQASQRHAASDSEYYGSTLPEKLIPLAPNKVEKFSFKKQNKDESDRKYYGRIHNLYVKQYGLTRMVDRRDPASTRGVHGFASARPLGEQHQSDGESAFHAAAGVTQP